MLFLVLLLNKYWVYNQQMLWCIVETILSLVQGLVLEPWAWSTTLEWPSTARFEFNRISNRDIGHLFKNPKEKVLGRMPILY